MRLRVLVSLLSLAATAGFLSTAPSFASANMQHFIGRCVAGSSLVPKTTNPKFNAMLNLAGASKTFQPKVCACVASSLQRQLTQEQADLLTAQWGPGNQSSAVFTREFATLVDGKVFDCAVSVAQGAK